MDEKFMKELARIVRDQVARKNDIRIPGLGSFRFEHVKQHQKQYNNGRVVMIPPEDRIEFDPDNQTVYDD